MAYSVCAKQNKKNAFAKIKRKEERYNFLGVFPLENCKTLFTMGYKIIIKKKKIRH